jgi:glycosyltransferase involved in cell wall biosynthesis
MMKVLVILWGPFGHRADELADAVEGERRSLALLYGPRYFAPLRYVALFVKTTLLLFTSKPDVVIAQNPPVFCPLTCLLYARLKKKRLIVDHHSIWRIKTVGGPVGRVIGLLEGVVARASYANTAPHSVWGDELARMGARRVLVVHDLVEKNPFVRDEGVRSRYGGGGTLAIASHGGHPLERLESEAAAASKVEGLTLVVTGPESKLRKRFAGMRVSGNVKYLGLLPMEDYLRLKASCDFALNITDEPFTLSHVIFEYIASGLPVVSSRQKVVEDVFGESLFYTEGTGSGEVETGVRELMETEGAVGEFRRRAEEKYLQLRSEHEKEVVRLRELVSL